MKKVFFAILSVSILGLAGIAFAADQTTVTGWVSDSQCGVKGANANHEACTKKCLSKGASMVVVTDGDQKVLTVDNPDALKGHEGHHIAATGEVKGDSIHVESAKMVGAKSDDKMQ